MKRKKLIGALIPVALVAAVAVWVFVGTGTTYGGAPTAASTDTALVERGNMDRTVYGSGVVEPEVEHSLYIPTDGIIVELNKEVGDAVEAGEVIAVLSGDQLEDQIDAFQQRQRDLDQRLRSTSKGASTSITAPVSGRVKLIFAKKRDPVSAVMRDHNALCTLSADGLMRVEFETDRDVSIGDAVQLSSSDTKKVEGTILSVRDGRVAVTVDDRHFPVNADVNVYDEDNREIGHGRLEINTPVSVTATVGTISGISVDENDKVDRGSRLFSVEDASFSPDYLSLIEDHERVIADLREAEDKRDELAIISPCDGVINALTLEEKSAVLEDQLLCKVEEGGRFKVVVNVDELDIPSVAIGQSASVKLTAFNYKSFDADVSRISAVGVSVNGVTNYPTSLILREAEGIYSGMSANADILVESKQDVLIIPLRALKVDASRTYVTKIDDRDAANIVRQDVEVEVGVVSGSRAEIMGGLSEGDKVELVGSSSSDLVGSMMERQADMQNAILGN
jgi:HlyD family secretion protein